jgi:hypothetical protein
MQPSPDARQYFPATERNRDPILAVLQQVLPPDGTVLEIASGSGEHSIYFAPNLPNHDWLPSDPNPEYLQSIAAWQRSEPAPNLRPPIALDVEDLVWSVESAIATDGERSPKHSPIKAIVAINMIHIAPWSACVGLLAGAKRILPTDGILYLYGPFLQNTVETESSNLSFDQSLRERNPAWGIRQLETVVEQANQNGLELVQTITMPANNLSVVFRKIC